MKDKPLVNMSEKELKNTFTEVSRPLNENLINSARAGGPESSFTQKMTIVVLITADGAPRLVHYNPEYGDGEGESGSENLVAEIIRQDLLNPGEHILSKTITVSLREADQIESERFE